MARYAQSKLKNGNPSNKMRCFKAFLFFTLLISCRDNTGDHQINIKGFWKYILSNPSTGAIDSINQFVEIKDTTIVFWHENIEYLPPLRYWVKGDSIIVRSLSSFAAKYPEKNGKDFFGILINIGTDSFKVFGEDTKYEFSFSDKETFNQVTGFKWIEDDY